MTESESHDLERPPGAPEWATPELLTKTLETWQPHYPSRLTVADALDILLSVSGLADAIR